MWSSVADKLQSVSRDIVLEFRNDGSSRGQRSWVEVSRDMTSRDMRTGSLLNIRNSTGGGGGGSGGEPRDLAVWFPFVGLSCDLAEWFPLVVVSCDLAEWFSLVVVSCDLAEWVPLVGVIERGVPTGVTSSSVTRVVEKMSSGSGSMSFISPDN